MGDDVSGVDTDRLESHLAKVLGEQVVDTTVIAVGLNRVIRVGTPDDPRVSGVVDWETAKLRDPRTELGYLLLYWRERGDPSPPLDDLAERHPDPMVTGARERERRGFWPFTRRQGSPNRQELVARWENATGLTYEDDRFYRAFGAVMLATVWERLYADALDRGEDADGWEAHVGYIAMLAEAIVDGDLPL